MPINRNFIFVVLLSFLSCDFSSLEKAKEVAGEVRSILESGEDVEVSGYADLAVTREEIDGVEVAVLSGNAGIGVSSASGSVGVDVEGSGYVSAAGKVSGHTVVSSKIESTNGTTVSGTTVYSSNSYAPVGGVTGSNEGVIEITEETSPSGAISGRSNVKRKGLEGESHLSGFNTSSTYSGGADFVEESYSSGPIMSGAHTGTVKEVYGQGVYLREAKESVRESLRLVKKIKKDYDSFGSYQTTSRSSMNLGETEKRKKAAEKAVEYTNERLNQDLDDLLGSVKRCLDSTTAATTGEGGFKSEFKAKKQLKELKEEVEKFVKEVEAGQKTGEHAYGTSSGTRQGGLLTMEASLKEIKKLLYKINKDNNLDD